MRQLIYVILGFLLLAGTQPLLGQVYSFQQLGVEEGLSQSVATSMVQDHKGRLWVGTMSGLSCYNGHEFTIVSEKDGLAEDWITSLYKDHENNIWIGHWGGGVSIWNAATNTFQDLHFEQYSNFKPITAIIQDKNNNIWFGTNGSGVFVYEIATQTIVTITEEEGFVSNEVYALCKDRGNNIWFGTTAGIAIYDAQKEMSDHGAFSVLTTADGLSSNSINSLILLHNKQLLAGSPANGLNLITPKSGAPDILHINSESGLPTNNITCLLEGRNGDYWIGTTEKGVLKYNSKNNTVKQFSARQGLNYFHVQSLFKDRENNIWIGTDLGINLFKGEQYLIYNEDDGLLNNIVWAVHNDNDGNLWLGTNKGLSKMRFEQSENTLSEKPLLTNYNTANGLSNEIVLSVFSDAKGRLWSGTAWGGVALLENERFSIIDQSKGLPSNTVFSIQEDETNRLWFGTSEGVAVYQPDNGDITIYNEADGLGGKHIYQIYRDGKNRLWFSILGGHLSMYENGKFIQFDSTTGIDERFITCISEDRDGNLWFGAYGSGIYRYGGKHFTNYSTKEGLSSDFPYSITCDHSNKLWIGNSRGIDQFDTQTQMVKQYRKKEGFMGIEPNPNAISTDAQGNIWVGTIMGVAKFDLNKALHNDQEALLHFTDIAINHQDTTLPNEHVLSYKDNNITFHYLGISLTNPDHVNYRYMLEGFDEDWSPVTRQSSATYSNLPPGSYTFKVSAANSDGKWNQEAHALSFTITPPFWKTWWFTVLVILFCLTVLYYGDKIRTHRLKVAKKQLEKKVSERTQELAEKNDELARKNRDILDSIHYARRIQGAILPTEKELKAHLPHSFVFYQPKDIVSGDFYWMEMVNDTILFAAADCTGHGVPGAFMSIIGFNGLNKIVKEEKVTQPAEILDRLSHIVEDTLQYSDDYEVNDGLDIAICALDTKKMKLQYAGAFNPLYMIRSGELVETKADRKPVGRSVIAERSGKFSNHEIDIQPNDAFYIFSDGYADQFGGPKGRKFRYSQFKELLVSAHQNPMNKQKEIIDKAIKDWKGEIEQIDDMVIMGVKVV